MSYDGFDYCPAGLIPQILLRNGLTNSFHILVLPLIPRSFAAGQFASLFLYQVAVKNYKSDLPGIIPSMLSNIHCLFFESILGIRYNDSEDRAYATSLKRTISFQRLLAVF
jgi:hypothetical protein